MNTKVYRVYTKTLTGEEKETLKTNLQNYSFFVTENAEYLEIFWNSSKAFPANIPLLGCPYKNVTSNPL